jgi:hypothetical protein
MKTIFILSFLLPSLIIAQVDSTKSKIKKNELTINTFELIIGGVLPISYERFIDDGQSVSLKAYFFDKAYADFGNSNNNVVSLQVYYNLYFSEKKQNAGFYFSPFLKYTKGNYVNSYYYYDYSNNMGYTKSEKLNVNAAITGFGIGYKYLWRKKLSFALNIDLGRVLNEQNYYKQREVVQIRTGLNVGVRF